MARIETDPNYSSPTFSRATAGTDLFKKEDVQALAAAMSTHTHNGAGTGLTIATVPAGAIGTGVITSTMIADGTIDTVDLKDGSVTSAKIAAFACQQMLGTPYTAVPTFSTTSTSAIATPIAVTFGSTANAQQVRIEATVTFQHSVAGASWYVGIGLDGAAPAPGYTGMSHSATANAPTTIALVWYYQPVAGAHSASVYVQSNSAGTLTATAVYSTMFVTEQRR